MESKKVTLKQRNSSLERAMGRKSKLKSKKVSLIRRTTWRCGKLEKQIISYLSKASLKSDPLTATVEEMSTKFKWESADELARALERLERRQLVLITTI